MTDSLNREIARSPVQGPDIKIRLEIALNDSLEVGRIYTALSLQEKQTVEKVIDLGPFDTGFHEPGRTEVLTFWFKLLKLTFIPIREQKMWQSDGSQTNSDANVYNSLLGTVALRGFCNPTLTETIICGLVVDLLLLNPTDLGLEMAKLRRPDTMAVQATADSTSPSGKMRLSKEMLDEIWNTYKDKDASKEVHRKTALGIKLTREWIVKGWFPGDDEEEISRDKWLLLIQRVCDDLSEEKRRIMNKKLGMGSALKKWQDKQIFCKELMLQMGRMVKKPEEESSSGSCRPEMDWIIKSEMEKVPLTSVSYPTLPPPYYPVKPAPTAPLSRCRR